MSILRRLKHKITGFTLTEVLLAVSIVGVIAALVLPATVTKFNDKVLENAYTRNIESIKNAVDSLVVTENKASFFETSMYSEATPDNYENKSGKFLKRNFRVSKYCGANATDCFTAKYHKINGIKKEEVTPSFGGSCAILKSGAAICIKPQVGQDASDASTRISGYIDVNGVKGPNILDRDLRYFTFPKKLKEEKIATVEDVKLQPNPLLSEADPDDEIPVIPPEEPQGPCDIDPNSLACCQTYSTYPSVYRTTRNHCCSYSSIANAYPSHCGLYAGLRLSCMAATSNGAEEDMYMRTSIPIHCDFIVDANPTNETFRLQIKFYGDETSAYSNFGTINSGGILESSILCPANPTGNSRFEYILRNSSNTIIDNKTITGGCSSSSAGSGIPAGGYEIMEQPANQTVTTGTPGYTQPISGMNYAYNGLPDGSGN